MRGWAVVAIGLLLGAGGLGAGSPAAAGGGVCSTAWAQDDAYSGSDAGDTPGDPLPLPSEGRFPGLLLPEGPVQDADAADWYAVSLPGAGEVVMIEASYPSSAALPLYVAYLDVAVWAPGATQASFHGSVTAVGGQNVTFTNDVPGAWRIRLTLPLLPTGAVPCPVAGGSSGGALPDARESGLYTLYFGCNPHCT